ncbi:MAG: S8 family serine peptidase, partial [Pseudomonadota bacterium]
DQNIYAPSAALVQSRIKIMPLKFLNGSGSGSTSDAIEAIYYAVQNGATVLNNSWGGTSYSAALHEAVSYTYDNGVSFVAAAGNAGSNNDSSPMYPASYDVPNVISVAATYDNFELTGFSNYGKRTVDLGAWGYFINSTVPGGAFGDSSGTSMSAPFVAGTAVQMLIEAPGMLGYQVKQIIEEETEFRSALAGKVQTQGRLHPTDSISKASTSVVATSQPDYNTNFSSNRELASEIAGGGCGMVQQMTANYNGSGKGPNAEGGGEFMQGGGMRMPGPKAWYVLLLLGILLAPILIATHLRSRGAVNMRAHQRYKIDSDVRVKVGDKELVGSVSSISLGGVQLNTEELLENGGIVSMTISSPEGKEQVQVEGRIVWSEEKKAYGVAFQDAPLSALDRISNWTAGLKKSS